MVWDYQIPTIVMLTHCMEGGRVSYSYNPSLYTSDFMVHLHINSPMANMLAMVVYALLIK